jgi:hypothetical protein
MRLHKNENCDFIRHKTLAISAIALLSFPATLNPTPQTSTGIELYSQYKISAAPPF